MLWLYLSKWICLIIRNSFYVARARELSGIDDKRAFVRGGCKKGGAGRKNKQFIKREEEKEEEEKEEDEEEEKVEEEE